MKNIFRSGIMRMMLVVLLVMGGAQVTLADNGSSGLANDSTGLANDSTNEANGYSDFWDKQTNLEQPTKIVTEGTDRYVFTISNASQLAWFSRKFRESLNNVEEKKRYTHAKLIIAGNIDLTGHWWRSIGNDDGRLTPFAGEVEGNGYTISNLLCNNGDSHGHHTGLFTAITGDCKIQDLKFQSCADDCQAGSDQHAILAGSLEGGGNIQLRNISFNQCRVAGQNQVGLLVGYVVQATSLTIESITVTRPEIEVSKEGGVLIGACQNVSTLKADKVAISGIGGKNQFTISSGCEIQSCFIGKLDKCSNFSFSDISIDGCKIEVRQDKSGMFSGFLCGIIISSSGSVSNVTVANCTTQGCTDFVGGLIGWHNTAKVGNITHRISLDNCRVVNTSFYNNGLAPRHYYGGLVGQADGIWDIKNCFTEVHFTDNRTEGWGGLIGKTYFNHTHVTITNCIAHIETPHFSSSDNSYLGGLVGKVDANSHVDIKTSGFLSSETTIDKNKGLLIGANNDGGSVGGTTCFISSQFKNTADSQQKKYAFGGNTISSKFTYYGSVYPYMEYTQEESSAVSYSAARMNELGACLGVQSHGTASSHRRQYLPLTDPLKGMVVRFSGADKVEKVKSTHLLESYGIYKGTDDTYAMMALGDTNIVQMKPLDNKWYLNINNDDATVSYRARKGSYVFHIALKDQEVRTARKFNIGIANIPKVTTFNGQYDPIRQRTTLSWIPNYIDKEDYDKLKNDFTWAVYRGTTLLTDSLPLDSCHYIDVTPNIQKDKEKTPNVYSVALVSKSMFLAANDGHASNSHAQCNVDAYDKIELSIKGVHNLDGVELSTEVPNSKRFDSCQVSLYRVDVKTANTIKQNIMAKQPKITDENLKEAFADSVRSERSGVMKVKVGQFKFDAASKDTYVKFACQDNLTDHTTNYYYIFCCDSFHDTYYKQFGAFFSAQYMYIPNTQVKITNLTCGKGESDSKTTITWKSEHAYNNMNVLYRVYRKLYSEDDSNLSRSHDTIGWDMLYEVTNSYLTSSYTDEALPGYVYRYRVSAYLLRNNEIDYDFIAADAADVGYTSGRGTILGKITYSSGGSRVKGVDVALTTDKESMKDLAVKPKTRYFRGSKDYLPLASGLSNDFWSGDWTVQFILRPTQNGRLVSIPGTMAVQYENGNLVMADNKMKINANGYNYIIIRHSSSSQSYQLGYAKQPDSTEVYAHYVVTVQDAKMKEWMTKKGENAITPLLAFGCISDSASTKIKGHQSFAGLLDEVRVWNKQLSEEEVRLTFDRYITGYEVGLQAYYTFDDGVRDYVYDISHTANGEQNGHHAAVKNRDVTSKQFYPDVVTLDSMTSVLCYRGTTDENGQYQIAGIPYCGEGTNFMVHPIYGTHEFYPTQTRRFVSKSSLVHQDVDFSDKSSFRVPVQAVYSGTTMPVQGLTVLVDGLPAKSTDGSVMTDAMGQATVSVPIGKHQLRLYAKGHEMANDGYACDISVDGKGNVTVKKSPLLDKDGYMDFQKDLVAPLPFYDNTRVALCGHAVGGSVENNKLMGDKTKINNIGPVIITLQAKNLEQYKFIQDDNVQSRDYSDFSAAKGVNCTVKYDKSSIVITTSNDKGEYLAMLPPIDYKVVHVQSTDVKPGQTALGDKDFELENIETSLSFDVSREYTDVVTTNAGGTVINARTYVTADSMVVDSIVSIVEVAQEVDSTISSNSGNGSNVTTTASYHLKKNFAFYVEPTLEVYNAKVSAKDSLMMGEEKVSVGSDETLTIWNAAKRDGSSDAYNLRMTYKKDGKDVTTGFPVFKMGENYTLKVKLYDNYVNRQTGKATHYDLSKVPISFVNGLASKGFTTLMTNDAEQLPETFSYTTIGDSVTSNTASNGVLEYTFTAGFPNAVYPYTQKLEISYEANNRIYTMKNPIEGIVYGAVPIPGKDFVTKGPNVVDLVLRDPPGSGSYSWIDAGSTVGNTYTYNHSGGADGGSMWHIGKVDAKIEDDETILDENNGLIKRLYYYENTFKDNHDHGFTVSVTGSGNNTKTVSYTFNDKLQTSASSGYVGEDGDIYIGRGMNIVFSKTREINFKKTRRTRQTPGTGVVASA